jgi:hypothetical protein
MADKFWWKGPDGSMKLVDMAEFQRAMRELRSSAETPPPGPGLGDVVAGATKAIGIKPCGKCQKRRQAMNKATPRCARRLLMWLRNFPIPFRK